MRRHAGKFLLCNFFVLLTSTHGRTESRKVSLNVDILASLIDTSPRKRKLLDKSIPNAILQNPEFAQDSQMYQDLLEMERKLDWTMMRKRVEVQDALGRTPSVRFFCVICVPTFILY